MFSPAEFAQIVALGREELVTRFVANFGAAKPFRGASPSTVVMGGFIRINVAPEYPLGGSAGFEFRATKGYLVSWVPLEAQVQRELNAPWRVALGRHRSKG